MMPIYLYIDLFGFTYLYMTNGNDFKRQLASKHHLLSLGSRAIFLVTIIEHQMQQI